jgi:hypothetical protein
VYIYVKGNDKVISIESNTVVMNSTKFDLRLGVDGLPELKIRSNNSKTLPINYLRKGSTLQLYSCLNKTALDKPKTIQYNDNDFVTFVMHTLKAVSLDGRGKV